MSPSRSFTQELEEEERKRERLLAGDGDTVEINQFIVKLAWRCLACPNVLVSGDGSDDEEDLDWGADDDDDDDAWMATPAKVVAGWCRVGAYCTKLLLSSDKRAFMLGLQDSGAATDSGAASSTAKPPEGDVPAGTVDAAATGGAETTTDTKEQAVEPPKPAKVAGGGGDGDGGGDDDDWSEWD